MCTRTATTPEAARARRRREGSFTLIETMIALAIIAFIAVEVAAVQGNSVVFVEYGRKVTQATWLARRVMSQVEYYWHTKPYVDLKTEVRDQAFEDQPDFTYNLEIKEWKFPFVKLLMSTLGGGGGDEEGDGGSSGADAGVGQMLETVVSQIFGDEPIFMTARVDVSWPDGANRASTGLTYLLTNQAKLDTAIAQLKPVYDKLTKPPSKKTDGGRKTDSGPGGRPPGGGAGTGTGTGTGAGEGGGGG